MAGVVPGPDRGAGTGEGSVFLQENGGKLQFSQTAKLQFRAPFRQRFTLS
jgi:hypothetical protein